MENTYVYHVNELQGINVPPLCSSQTLCAINWVKFTRCVVILMLFLSSLQGCAIMTFIGFFDRDRAVSGSGQYFPIS